MSIGDEGMNPEAPAQLTVNGRHRGEKNISYRVTEERWKLLRQAGLDRNESLQTMLDKGVTLLLGGSNESECQTGTVLLAVPADIARDVRRFTEVLTAINPKDDTEAARNLRIAFESLKIIERFHLPKIRSSTG
jgi:hypothetical protein